jgi:hypothetical protein
MIKLNLIKTEIKFISKRLNLSCTQRGGSLVLLAFAGNTFCDAHKFAPPLFSLAFPRGIPSELLRTPRLLQFGVFKEQVCNRRVKRVRPVADSPLALVRQAFGTQGGSFVPRFFFLESGRAQFPTR